MTDLAAGIEEIKAKGECAPRWARDPVNLPMINNWLEAMQNHNPLYRDTDLAPPSMAQVWTMRGLHPAKDVEDPMWAVSGLLDAEGFTSVVATNCEQRYLRYLRHGERLKVGTRLVDVVGPKKTGLGEGYFVTTESTWYSDDEPVATMMFRLLKYKPGTASPAPALTAPSIRPLVGRDTEFFWKGTQAGELRIQRCGECGVLRHPPGPMCPSCGATKPEHVVAQGVGEVYSYVVHHHPPVPGRSLPIVVALVQLPEGVRVLAELVDVPADQVRVGMPVRIDFAKVDDELTMPVWRDAEELPPLTIDVTPTFVIASALSTRDFQDVHHDRDLALQRGSKDIFVNILTTNALVERFVTDWAGPEARIAAISIRLGVPCYAYDTLTLRGRASAPGVIDVVGTDSLGKHVTGQVHLA